MLGACKTGGILRGDKAPFRQEEPWHQSQVLGKVYPCHNPDDIVIEYHVSLCHNPAKHGP